MNSGRRFILTLRPEPEGRDHLGREPAYRLKLVLKRLLRDAGFRCIDLRDEGVEDRIVPTPATCGECEARKRAAVAR